MQTGTQGQVALVTEAGGLLGIGYAAARVLGQDEMRLAIRSTEDRIHDAAVVVGDRGNAIQGAEG